MEAKEEVRSRLNIEDVIGEYVQLKRAGRNWKGLSPFSNEKTPSFFVSPEKQIWHDFSSNRGGDIFSFVMEVEGLEFREALELLARKAGVDLEQYRQAGDRGVGEKKKRLYAALEAAATYYQRSLLATPSAIDYVSKKRGLTRQVVHDFRIGYAPSDGDSVKNFLLQKKYSQQDIRDAGLVGSRGTDMFRERMVVPLMDGQGRVVGFTARLVRDIDNAPKYINTPQTLLYDKGRHVFGLHLAKQAIREHDYVVIVEGNLDVVSSHQAGVKQVVATAGTAMTEHHLKALSRLTSHVRLAFDGDRAGIAATERAIPIAQTVGVELSIVTLPDSAKDPDELIQQDVSKWQQVIEKPKPAIEWVIEQYASRLDMETAAGKRELATATLALLGKVPDPVERDHYLQMVARKTSSSLEALTERLRQLKQPQKHLKPTRSVELAPEQHAHEDYLLALLSIDTSAHDVVKQLETDDFHGDERRMLFRYLRDDPRSISVESLPESLREIETYVKLVLFKAETRYETLDAQGRLVEAVSLVHQIKEQHLREKKQILLRELREAEQRHDDEAISRLNQALNKLIKENARAPRRR